MITMPKGEEIHGSDWVKPMQLTAEQIQTLQAGQPLEVLVGDTRCVVLPKEVFERLQNLLVDDSDWSPEAMRRALARSTAANGWDEVGMDAYDRYDEERGQP